MTNKKSTKKALIFSVLSLVLCLTMLVGTTFAWFTDSVTSGKNVIVAGNLDLEVEYSNDGVNWYPMDENSELFENDALWEPGYTTAVALRVKNVGTLAFKYSVATIVYSETESTNVLGEQFKLSNYLVVRNDVATGDAAGDAKTADYLANRTNAQTLPTIIEFGETFVTDSALNAEQYSYAIMSITMPEHVGNEANYDKAKGYATPTIEFGVNVVATQYTYEEDNFDNQYDKDASNPVVSTAYSQTELNEAIANGADIIYLADGTYNLPATKNNAFSLIGNGHTVINLAKAMGQSLSGTDITFENLTVQGDNSNYHGIQHAGEIVYNNVVFNESTTLYGESVTFNDCTFNLTSRYIWTYGANEVTFNNCTFCTEGKAVLAYKETDPATYTVNINDCTFYATEAGYTSSGDHCAAVEIDSHLVGAYVINFNGTNTVHENFNGLYRIKSQKNPANVTINQNGIVATTTSVPVTNADDLATVLEAAGAAKAGDSTIVLTGDIDLTGTAWESINVDGYNGAGVVTVLGNGNTITGLTAPLFAGGFAGKSGIVIKDLTIANSNIAGSSQGGGAFIDCADSMQVVTLENCHLVNSTVSGGRVGGLLGWCSGYSNENDGPVKTYVTITNCSVEGCTINGAGSAGGIAGHPGASDYTYTTIENCVVKNTNIVSTETGSWRTGAVIGTANNGHIEIKNVVVENATLTQNGVVAQDVVLYGRFVPSGTGTLVIDGVKIDA